MIRKTQAGYWIVDGDTHIGKWVDEGGSLNCDSAIPYITKFIKEGDTVVDIGANIGVHTRAYLKAVGPRGRVFAFEPNPEPFQCLTLNCRRSISLRIGIADQTSTGTFVQSPNVGASYIAKGAGDVALMALDDIYMGRVHLVKIDVEGYEPGVIAGARKTLEKYMPVVVCEVNRPALYRQGYEPADVLDTMKSLGYHVLDVFGFEPDYSLPQWDALFTKDYIEPAKLPEPEEPKEEQNDGTQQG